MCHGLRPVCLGSVRTWSNCQKLVALCYWSSTWRCGASRQAIDTKNTGRAWPMAVGLVPPGGNDMAGALGRRLAPGGARGPPSGLEPSSAQRHERRAKRFWVQSWLSMKSSSQLWMSVMMWRFGWGPNYECNLYWGNTWPLEVVAWWIKKSSGVCEIVARTTRF